MLKCAKFAEMAIVYGNRYRSSVQNLNEILNKSEVLFFKGEYQSSLDITLKALNNIEPGIEAKLKNMYQVER